MSRRPRSFNQPLLIVLAIIVLLSILAYVNRRSGESKTPVAAEAPTTAPSLAAADEKPALPPLLITQTPTAAAPQTGSSPPPTPAAVPGDALVSADAPAAPVKAPTTRPSWDLLLAAAPVDAPPSALPTDFASMDLPAIVAEAQKRLDAGDLIAAQAMFSHALTSGRLSPDQAQRIRQTLDPVGRQIVFSTRRYPDWQFGGTYQVQPGDSLQKIARLHNITWELLGRMNDISDPRKLRAGRAIKVITGPFGAVIHKSRFEMEIWLCGSSMPEPGAPGSLYVTSFRVGLGKAGSTPTGTWLATPGGKQKNPKFWGAGDLPPMEADDPQNPLGEFWIALTGIAGDAENRESYGIHGTIDPSSIGKEASLGCIRLADDDIALVYELLVDGKSRVIVKE